MNKDSLLFAWISSFRLKTLPLALSSVFIGNALAYWHGEFQWAVFIFTFITASLLQTLSNLANDYGDVSKGADPVGRLGPKRGIHQGLLSVPQIRVALVINLLCCIVFGLLLLFAAKQTNVELIGFIILGALAIIAAITYTVGDRPYGYRGFGDLSVLVFFGLVSVLGSYYLQVHDINLSLILPALACGLLIVTVLNMNNLRDYDGDKACNKRTFIVLIGLRFGVYYHCALFIIALLLFMLFSLYELKTYVGWLFMITFPWVYKILKTTVQAVNAEIFVAQFVVVIQLALIINVLYCIGIILS